MQAHGRALKPRAMPNGTCVVCGASFPMLRAGRLYCSTRCASAAGHKRDPKRRKQTYRLTCEGCGLVFETTNKQKRRCSPACNMRVRRRLHPPVRTEPMRLRRWTVEEVAYLREHYPLDPIAAITETLAQTPAEVIRKAGKLGLKSGRQLRTDSIRHDYFSRIDTPAKAYVLGFLAADGCVSRSGQLSIYVHEKDGSVIELIRDELAPLAVFHAYPAAHGAGPKVGIAIQSPQLATDLARFGIVPAKSLILDWPTELPEERTAEFILGAFDGDGSLSMLPNRMGNVKPRWHMTGQIAFLTGMADAIERQVGVRPRGPRIPKRGRFAWVTADSTDAITIDAWIHRSGLGLVRKRIPADFVLVTHHRSGIARHWHRTR